MSKTIKTWTPQVSSTASDIFYFIVSLKIQEDAVLVSLVEQASPDVKWGVIARRLEVEYNIQGRSGKQCRERWTNNLNPAIKDEEWNQQEDDTLFALHAKMGNKWSVISKSIPGRTDNCVKNRFYSALRKAMRRVNRFIQNTFKRVQARPFPPTMLSKILFITENADPKISFSPEILSKCQRVLSELVYYSSERQDNLQESTRLKALALAIGQINRSYKKKKPKRKRKNNSQSEQSEEQPFSISLRPHSSPASPVENIFSNYSDLFLPGSRSRSPSLGMPDDYPQPFTEQQCNLHPQTASNTCNADAQIFLSETAASLLENQGRFMVNNSMNMSMPFFTNFQAQKSMGLNNKQDPLNYFLGESKNNFQEDFKKQSQIFRSPNAWMLIHNL